LVSELGDNSLLGHVHGVKNTGEGGGDNQADNGHNNKEDIFLIKTAFKNGRTSAPDIIYFIKQASRGSRTVAEATKKDLAAWKEVFNGYNSWRKIKKEIQKEWMYPGIKAIILQHKIVGVIVVLKNISKKSRVIDDIYRCKNAKVISLKNNQLLKIT